MIKSEVDFGVDNFGDPKLLSPDDTIVQLLLNILFMRPGQLPSMPHIGIDIRSKLYSFVDELDTEELKQDIISQCRALMPYLNLDTLSVNVVDYNNDSVLVITFPTISQNSDVLVALKKSEDNGIIFNYTYDDGSK